MARVSELLQSQLLQPLNITPAQPQQAENNWLAVSGLGPADSGMNEFNRSFARNGASWLASGIAGSDATYGNETVLSGIYHPASFSLGQMHLQTQGFRKNDDIDENLYTAFVQAEYRHRDIPPPTIPASPIARRRIFAYDCRRGRASGRSGAG